MAIRAMCIACMRIFVKKNNEACESLEDLKPAAFYLCGWKFMIDDARKKITELGYDKKSIHFELYG